MCDDCYLLLGSGHCGDVDIALHEGEAEPIKWNIQVRIGQFEFCCDVDSTELMCHWAAFFEETFRTGRFLDKEVRPGVFRHMEPKELELGSIGDVPIFIQKDGEFDDRYFLRVCLATGYVDYTPTIEQVESLIMGKLVHFPSSTLTLEVAIGSFFKDRDLAATTHRAYAVVYKALLEHVGTDLTVSALKPKSIRNCPETSSLTLPSVVEDYRGRSPPTHVRG